MKERKSYSKKIQQEEGDMPFYTNSIHISKPFARNVTMGHHDNVSGSTKLANWGYIP